MQIFFKIFNKLKKIRVNLFIAVLLILVLGFTSYSFAADKITKTLDDFQKGLSDNTGQNKQSFDFQSAVGVTASFYTLLAGCGNSECPEELKAGAVNYVNQAIADVYSSPPASGVYYAIDLGKKFNIISPAYAATPFEGGFGFSALEPFLNLWRASRNITYVLFVLFIVFLGFMIMFKQKISPQAVMTVQAALPRAITALILITFSYAIVGFFIDLMYVLFALLVFGLQAGGANIQAGEAFKTFSNSDFTSTAWFIVSRGASSIGSIFLGFLSYGPTFAGLGILGALATIAGILAGGGSALGVAALPVVLGLVVTFIFFLIKILFSLAKAYLMLIIHLVFAPFFILWAALTGGGVYRGWLKGVLANLFVFFVVGVLIFFTDTVITQLGEANEVWGPPYLGNHKNIIIGMIGIGAIVLISQMPEFVNQLFDIRGHRLDMPGVGRETDQLSKNIQSAVDRNLNKTASADTGAGGTGTPKP